MGFLISGRQTWSFPRPKSEPLGILVTSAADGPGYTIMRAALLKMAGYAEGHPGDLFYPIGLKVVGALHLILDSFLCTCETIHCVKGGLTLQVLLS